MDFMANTLKEQIEFKNELLKIVANGDDKGFVTLELLNFILEKCYKSEIYEDMTSLEQEEVQDILEKAKQTIIGVI